MKHKFSPENYRFYFREILQYITYRRVCVMPRQHFARGKLCMRTKMTNDSQKQPINNLKPADKGSLNFF